MSSVDFLGAFFACHLNFFGIDHNDEISSVDVWCKGGFIFPTQYHRDLTS